MNCGVNEATSRVENYFHQHFIAEKPSNWKEEYNQGSFDTVVFEPHPEFGLVMHAFGNCSGKDIHIDIIPHKLFNGYICNLDEEEITKGLFCEFSVETCDGYRRVRVLPIYRPCRRGRPEDKGVEYEMMGDLARYKKWKLVMREAFDLYVEKVLNIA